MEETVFLFGTRPASGLPRRNRLHAGDVTSAVCPQVRGDGTRIRVVSSPIVLPRVKRHWFLPQAPAAKAVRDRCPAGVSACSFLQVTYRNYQLVAWFARAFAHIVSITRWTNYEPTPEARNHETPPIAATHKEQVGAGSA